MNAPISRTLLFWLLLAAAMLWFISAVQAILLPFIVGMGVAYFLDPAADRLERMGCSRTVATALITALFFGLLALGFIWLVPIIIHQAEALIAALPGYMDSMRTELGALGEQILAQFGQEQVDGAREAAQSTSKELAAALGSVLHGLISSGAAIASLISLIIISPIVSFYLLRDWDRMIDQIDRLLPRAYAETIREQARRIDATLSGYVRGVLNVMLALGAFYALSLGLIGLHFAVLIGLLGGIAIIVPYIGTIVSGAAAVGMAYLQFDDWQPVALTLAVFTAGQMLEGYVLTPKLVGERVGLHPLWLIFGMLAGAALFGFVGVLLAVPITAVIGVLIRFAIERYRESDLYGPEDAQDNA